MALRALCAVDPALSRRLQPKGGLFQPARLDRGHLSCSVDQVSLAHTGAVPR